MKKEYKKIQFYQLNAIKGMSIYLVVCIHFVYSFFTPENKPLLFEMYNYVTQLAVPFFMIIGGFFFCKKFLKGNKNLNFQDILKALSGLFVRVVVPYYIFTILLSFYNISTTGNIFWKQFLFIDSRGNGLYFLIIYTYSVLFSIFLLSIFQYGFSNKKIIFLIPVVSLLFYPVSHFLHQAYPDNGIVLALPLISFFASGMPIYLMFEKMINDKYACRRLFIIGVSIFVLFMYTLMLYIARKYIGYFSIFTSSPPTIYRMIYCIIIFIISLVVFSFDSIISLVKRYYFLDFGVNSLFIFLIHPYFVKIIVPFVCLIFAKTKIDVFSNWFFLPLLLVSYMVTYLSHKFLSLVPVKLGKFFIT